MINVNMTYLTGGIFYSLRSRSAAPPPPPASHALPLHRARSAAAARAPRAALLRAPPPEKKASNLLEKKSAVQHFYFNISTFYSSNFNILYYSCNILKVKCWTYSKRYWVFLDYTIQLRTSQRIHTHPYEYTYANLTPYEHLRRLSRQILEINEVTTGTSLSTRTSPTTECTTSLNPKILS